MSETMYVVTAYRWGNVENHSYVVGVFSTPEKATSAARQEYCNRAGKYECEITEHVIDYIEEYEQN